MSGKVTMSVADALDYSSGRVLAAMKSARGSSRDAIHLANWPDVAISLRSAIDQLPTEGAKVLLGKKMGWSETSADDLACGHASARAVTEVVQSHWDQHHTACEACDRVKAALDDAQVSVADLSAAMYARGG